MDEAHEHPRQERLPALVHRARVAGAQHGAIGRGKGLDQIEDRVPEARLHLGALLIARRVLLRELRQNGLEPRVDAQQRLGLRRADDAPAPGKVRDELQRLLLQRHRVRGRQAGDPLGRRIRTPERVLERPDPGEGGLEHGSVRARPPVRNCGARRVPRGAANAASVGVVHARACSHYGRKRERVGLGRQSRRTTKRRPGVFARRTTQSGAPGRPFPSGCCRKRPSLRCKVSPGARPAFAFAPCAGRFRPCNAFVPIV